MPTMTGSSSPTTPSTSRTAIDELAEPYFQDEERPDAVGRGVVAIDGAEEPLDLPRLEEASLARRAIEQHVAHGRREVVLHPSAERQAEAALRTPQDRRRDEVG